MVPRQQYSATVYAVASDGLLCAKLPSCLHQAAVSGTAQCANSGGYFQQKDGRCVNGKQCCSWRSCCHDRLAIVSLTCWLKGCMECESNKCEGNKCEGNKCEDNKFIVVLQCVTVIPCTHQYTQHFSGHNRATPNTLARHWKLRHLDGFRGPIKTLQFSP